MQRWGKLMWLYNDLTPHKRVIGLAAFIYFTLRNKFRRDSETGPIWLIGEARGKCLKENGYHFFLYCRAQHPEINAYFVVDKSSPQQKDLSDTPHVLTYGSARHINIYLQATTCFYTHTYSDFIFRELFLLYHKSKKLVFLHHGVLGFKKFDQRYDANRNLMDLFVVGSTLERDILIEQAGVDPDKVKVTGYPRYDSMTNSASSDNLQIAYLPTHRNWLKVPKNNFRDTDFYKNVNELINLSDLTGFLSNNNITLKVYLHAVNTAVLNPIRDRKQADQNYQLWRRDPTRSDMQQPSAHHRLFERILGLPVLEQTRPVLSFRLAQVLDIERKLPAIGQTDIRRYLV